ncbi:MAG: hypothetical protein BGP24_05840 [Lysobacterales bacterium 69-70]|nr:hypothetical protein [Xanthomonadaceae bacterium]ODU34881.1 MAG: hypothetical protein ABS97_06825 [Xanthomonadaceae bacterium SCN 69-320]ODV19772.1 MAG: hypothetical protein ABT27_10185 [Xanthomonadaceae bacterium SCN 69-25]OJY95133.1 MAG: hypothetical protein BGP24_05840 [Xanthomonadales bacterium 69-70]
MHNAETLDALFALLREMTLDRRKSDTEKKRTVFHRLELITVTGYSTSALILAVSLGMDRNLSSAFLAFVGFVSAAGAIVFGVAFVLIALAHQAWDLWQSRKRPYENLFALLQIDLQADTRYLIKLAAYDKATLQYALLQYHHQWNTIDSRLSLLIGDLRKVGFFPAFAASAVSASMLLKNDSSLWLWLPLLVLATLQVLLFPLHVNRERPQQVAELLRFAIEHATASPATATVAEITTSAAVETTEVVLTAALPVPPSTAATRPATALPAAPSMT